MAILAILLPRCYFAWVLDCLLGLINTPDGALHAPHPLQLLIHPPKIKSKLFPETKCFPSGLTMGYKGNISFHWDNLHPTELHRI